MSEGNTGITGAWRRFKLRMKRTWIGWFYICIRRDVVGNMLLFVFVCSTFIAMKLAFPLVANPQLASWDELECRSGSVVKVFWPPRNQRHSTLEIVDQNGVKHSYLGWGGYPNFTSRLQATQGEAITVCSRPYWELWPPFYYQQFVRIEFSGDEEFAPRLSPFEERAFDLKWVRGCLWVSLFFFIWMLKRFGREAWQLRDEYLQSLHGAGLFGDNDKQKGGQ